MNLTLHHEQGRHAGIASRFFQFERLDAFHTDEVLQVMHGGDWESLLVTDGNRALLHNFSKKLIPGTQWYDCEPLLGYAGPVATARDPEFLESALRLVDEYCRETGIIAQVVRFNPLLENHSLFVDLQSGLQVQLAKHIVIVPCFEEDQRQLAVFTRSRRRDIRRSRDQLQLMLPKGEGEWRRFQSFVSDSLQRVGADNRWFLGDDFFLRAAASDCFVLYSVKDEEGVKSTIAVVHHPLASYVLLAANSEDNQRGFAKCLWFEAALDTARRKIPWLILGGGNSSSSDDSLLRWKLKFAKRPHPFFIGAWTHDHEAFEELCLAASDSRKGTSQRFLKYRDAAVPERA